MCNKLNNPLSIDSSRCPDMLFRNAFKIFLPRDTWFSPFILFVVGSSRKISAALYPWNHTSLFYTNAYDVNLYFPQCSTVNPDWFFFFFPGKGIILLYDYDDNTMKQLWWLWSSIFMEEVYIAYMEILKVPWNDKPNYLLNATVDYLEKNIIQL